MDTERLYIWICFFFSIALAAGGAILFFQKKAIREIPPSRFLQYFLVLVYAFGFYSIWSNALFHLFFTERTHEAIAQLPEYLTLIGIPFLITGMFMLLLWALNLLEKKPGKFFLPLASLLILVMLLAYVAYKRFDLLANVRQLYALFIILTAFVAGSLLCFSGVKYVEKKPRRILILLVFFFGTIHIPLFLDRLATFIPELIFIFLFFFTTTFIGVYFAYTVKVPPLKPEDDGGAASFERFIREYGITGSESEVVQEIYKGKTNQEIADKLFVTVQTIKDHTHRIYLKTNLKNRAQLTSLLRKYEHPAMK
ncbi:regulatory LuxR family protein [Anseongella ginsenosidimutans]|uniref:Regulatory LuxR family protein n=1 Tax=Anseongella ginsenosidimutans TaxID=496056 RepID=A0A4R3KUG7_9SPHI|nr:helix-turn-helix transcriptional regulator [Anseongella ginsenosidimutans]QEC53556.1 helix-turn-helix transcriptional regulator [Anseongella ginsenosidimutans]TCS88463.1 regulatory LuxR family protein [Anseongella ginsenosidimutans]